ncbi:hypothetical protein GCM10011507_23600 [Edaphobacter acidisoli]|uniref:IPTL-CTERM protein sorting domain-containing protein n=1 Tax=Edaphobacter acidisoli TaxID=2040573 RepID=A0A916W6J6_9BACT|nr:hypothetical protein [Edaphobacter acidisoli]GGA71242.1 hypothetical protein GCM10011507_23600 [Edaphobacter acidisoli]
MRKTSLFLLLAALAVAPLALRADSYDYTISAAAANGDPNMMFSASGTMTGTTDPYNSAAVDVTAITGSASGYNFQSVVDPGTTNTQTQGNAFGFTFDNVLYPASGAAHADSTGFLIDLGSPLGTSLAHVYYTGVTSQNPGGYEVDVVDPNEPGASTPFGVANPFSVSRFTVTRAPSAVPEAASVWLLGTGLACLAGLAIWRVKQREIV